VLLRTRGWGRTKPPSAGARLDSAHPLARGLAGFWLFGPDGPRAANLVTGREAVRGTAGTVAPAAGRSGPALRFNGAAGSHLTAESLDAGATWPTELTVDTVFNLATVSQSGALFKVGYDTQGIAVGIGGSDMDSNGSNLLILREFLAWVNTGVTHTLGWHHLLFDYSQTTSVARVSMDGAEVYNANIGSINATPPAEVHLGGYTTNGGGSRHHDNRQEYARIWTRLLEPAEQLEAYRAPYDLVWTPRYWYVGAQTAVAAASLVLPPPAWRFAHMAVR
jgi:hypothetical protein